MILPMYGEEGGESKQFLIMTSTLPHY